MKSSNKIEILDRKEVFRKYIFRIESIRFRLANEDGSLGDPVERLNLDRGDSVAALVHDVHRDCILLAEQFRIATFEKGPGWICELPAGILEKDETPEASVCREVEEEIGYTVKNPTRLATVYASPGGSSERLHIFYVPVDSTDRTSSGGGLASEGESIQLVEVPVDNAFEMLDKCEIVDAKTVIAIQWLRLQRSKR